MTPLYIFDLDGTLAVTEHRQHILMDKEDRQRWARFYAACVDDTPNWPVVDTFCHLASVADVLIWSGREASVREATVSWLLSHLGPRLYSESLGGPGDFRGTRGWFQSRLTMRPVGDYTPDDQLKLNWHMNLDPADQQRLVAVFDDRNRMVKAWRSHGIACFQVAEGEF